MSQSSLLVFTDLDGTLLDHHSYSFRAALPMINALAELKIPLIPTTSKTRVELLLLREELANEHPFITENGAAVYIPVNYFSNQPEGTIRAGDFWVKGFALARSEWGVLLSSLPASSRECFKSFTDLGDQGIAEATGLNLDQASMANQREYSEPLLWLGTDEQKEALERVLLEQHITMLEGGRFVHMSTGYNKGKAMLWLADCYAKEFGTEVCTLALGDGGNDKPMLELADFPVVIRPADNKAPLAVESAHARISESPGPLGWNQMVHQILKQQGYLQ